MFGQGGKRFSLIWATTKAMLVIAGLSWCAAQWMSSAAGRNAMTQMAARAGYGEEPTMTGSIPPRAAGARIDACKPERDGCKLPRR